MKAEACKEYAAHTRQDTKSSAAAAAFVAQSGSHGKKAGESMRTCVNIRHAAAAWRDDAGRDVPRRHRR